MSDDSKKMMLGLKITILTHCGEDEDEVYKHLCNILYDHDSDIVDIVDIGIEHIKQSSSSVPPKETVAKWLMVRDWMERELTPMAGQEGTAEVWEVIKKLDVKLNPQPRKVTITYSPCKDDEVPFTYEEEGFIRWFDEVFQEGYKKTPDYIRPLAVTLAVTSCDDCEDGCLKCDPGYVPSFDECLHILEINGYEVDAE